MAEFNYKIGGFEKKMARKRPTLDRFKNWAQETLNDPLLDDYDAYLWGSFPENKRTWDADILLQHPNANMDTEEMEAISLLSLENSMGKNQFLIDLGFNAKESIAMFEDSMNNYKKTGNKTINSGFVYADEWFADDIKFKNRKNWTDGSYEALDNNMIKLGSQHPYEKQLKDEDSFNRYYKNKPIKIKDRKRNY